jgi:hypothetical protein
MLSSRVEVSKYYDNVAVHSSSRISHHSASGSSRKHFGPRFAQLVANRSRRNGRLPKVLSNATRDERKEHIMLPTNFRIRLTAAALAVLTSATLLGSVVLGMQATSDSHAAPVVAMEGATGPVQTVN